MNNLLSEFTSKVFNHFKNKKTLRIIAGLSVIDYKIDAINGTDLIITDKQGKTTSVYLVIEGLLKCSSNAIAVTQTELPTAPDMLICCALYNETIHCVSVLPRNSDIMDLNDKDYRLIVSFTGVKLTEAMKFRLYNIIEDEAYNDICYNDIVRSINKKLRVIRPLTIHTLFT